MSQITLQVRQLPDYLEHSPAYLVGDVDNLSCITGEVYDSSTMPGLMAVETEHGTLYLDPEEEVLISDTANY